MKISVVGLGILIMLIGCSPGRYCYTDLDMSEKFCKNSEFPFRQHQNCPSGKFDYFSIQKLTDFGERPRWSPDGEKIAFLDKAYGNVYEITLITDEIKCLTCDYEHNGFFEVHYLKDGDYLLLGPREKTSKIKGRFFHNGFYWMPSDLSQPPKWMGEEHYEGAAVSSESRMIAYAKTWADSLFKFPSTMYVAEVTKDGTIINQKPVHKSPYIIEANSFLPGDDGLIFTLYTSNKEVYGIDFQTNEVTNYSNCRSYEAPGDIFPDGRFVLMESNRHSKTPYLDALKSLAVSSLDIYMLNLDGTGKDARRLTHFSDISGERAYDPVVSPEGCRIAFLKETSKGGWYQFQETEKGIYLMEFYSCHNDED